MRSGSRLRRVGLGSHPALTGEEARVALGAGADRRSSRRTPSL